MHTLLLVATLMVQFYPKVSVSYIPSDSGNWSGLGPISSLQLRTAYGMAGLQPGAFDAFTSI